MRLTYQGPKPFELDASGSLRNPIASLFLNHKTMVTDAPLHALQRESFRKRLDETRQGEHRPPLTSAEWGRECESLVDLIIEPNYIVIRPDPSHLDVAMRADRQLQTEYPKERIRFLSVTHPSVFQRLKRAGELWRISPKPCSPRAMRDYIEGSRLAIGLTGVYYYNRYTGTRYLTCHGLAQLGSLSDEALRHHLQEIAVYLPKSNGRGGPELRLWPEPPGPLAHRLEGTAWADLENGELKRQFNQIVAAFREQTPRHLREDDLNAAQWRSQMFGTLQEPVDHTTEGEVEGLDAEFTRRVRWLPGARFDRRECVFDSVFDTHADTDRLCDGKVKEFIFNFVREFGDLEYVNVGRLDTPIARQTDDGKGRRDVYLAELKPRGAEKPVIHVIRLQGWGIREHLEQGKALDEAMLLSQDYTDFILDRRLGCRQLGMNLPAKVYQCHLNETYQWKSGAETVIWVTYFEREFVEGTPSDVLPDWRLGDESYTDAFARLLGQAAAPNLIVGRADGATPIFDLGDEVVIEDSAAAPVELVVCDHSGSFANYKSALTDFAKGYAQPVNSRADKVPRPRQFARVYLDALAERLRETQTEYRQQPGAFDSLFKHRKRDRESFACRWDEVLKRLASADIPAITNAIEAHITVVSTAC